MAENINIIESLEKATDAPADPLPLFEEWLALAATKEPCDPNAMALATADAHGFPSVRIVLLKDYNERGFVFYTNKQSRKGQDLAANPHAALCLYWKSLNRQIHVKGRVESVSDAEADAYYASRPRGSRIGAWASQQSRLLDCRSTLAQRVREFDEKFAAGDIPRPPHWGGYRLVPSSIEFWCAGKSRLHTRLLYSRENDNAPWERSLLFP